MALTHAIATWNGFYHNPSTGDTEGTWLIEATGPGPDDTAQTSTTVVMPDTQAGFDTAVDAAVRQALSDIGVNLPAGRVLIRPIRLA